MCSSYDCLDANNNSLKKEQNIYILFYYEYPKVTTGWTCVDYHRKCLWQLCNVNRLFFP